MDVQVKLDQFEGPLDLLLHLIERSEVDIYEISITEITNQYIEILDQAKELRLEIASEFVVMAATLLAIKSRMLLPTKPSNETLLDGELEEWSDPREQLIERLLEYKRYKRLGQVLAEREAEQSRLFGRAPIDLSAYAKEIHPLKGTSLDAILSAFEEILRQNKRQESEPTTKLIREEISVSDRMEEIVQFLKRRRKVFFTDLCTWSVLTRERIITTFLALLELMRGKQVYCVQTHPFKELEITWIGKEERVLIHG
ncbi:condensin subunit ScpA [Seinonella peptonophila]|uniref:Segregation and condensation protein A n=1 Tax=Seinonella peptonophila TaxID=112248 RepID=A0A1M4TJA8_9BACL|nr:segregation/condensation protein A [Seinonella peptonophila]SHE44550.1 condensin subunit ScpA [Seinonella peptonophila]